MRWLDLRQWSLRLGQGKRLKSAWILASIKIHQKSTNRSTNGRKIVGNYNWIVFLQYMRILWDNFGGVMQRYSAIAAVVTIILLVAAHFAFSPQDQRAETDYFKRVAATK